MAVNHVRPVATLAAIALVTLAACSSSETDPIATSDAVVPTRVAVANTAVPVADAPCEMADPIDQILEIASTVFGSVDRVSVHFTPCTVDQPTPNPIIYLLHGANADETQWPDVDIFAAADAAVTNGTMRPSILVAPDSAPAYSCGNCVELLYAHLVDEIEPAIRRTAPVDASRRAIGGISRGGGLALQVAAYAPDQFVAVGAHSSVQPPELAIESIAAHHIPARFDVGDDDSLAVASTQMALAITSRGGIADLVVGAGGHDRDYWRSQAGAYIAFYATYVG